MENNKIDIDLNLINQPMDAIKLSIGKKIYVKCKNNRELTGILHVRTQNTYNILYSLMIFI